MSTKIYRQYDSRWGSLPYPSKKTNLSNSGCGCLAVYHCAIENPKYANLTVKQCYNYMYQFSKSGQGTDWAGIKKGLEHYGYKVHWNKSDGMKEIWSALKSSLNRGVILFRSGKAPNGTVWTTSGHYVAFTNYRIKDGRHEFYCKDSGTRKHDGWYSYERSMKGCIVYVYICKSYTSTQTVTKKKTVDEVAKEVVDGKWGTGDDRKARLTKAGYDYNAVQKRVNELLQPTRWDNADAWAKKISGGKYHYVKWNSKDKKTQTCPICTGRKYDDHFGWNCIGYAWAIWRHGAGLKNACNCGVISNDVAEKVLKASSDAKALEMVQKRCGLKDIKVIRNKNGIPKKSWKAGDICMQFNGNKYVHTFYYLGDSKVSDAGNYKDTAKQIAVRNYKNYTCKIIVRYAGK